MPKKRAKKIKPITTDSTKKVAVVDIGSNSVRMVIYDTSDAKPIVLHQTKTTCRLAEGLSREQPHLNPLGMEQTLKTLRAFRLLIQKHKVPEVMAVATAAMRAVAATKQGRHFHRKTEQALGSPITIISGRAEARLMAYGVMADQPKLNGICGDLGGGSLELAAVSKGQIHHTATLELGSLTLFSEAKGHTLVAAYLARDQIHSIPFLSQSHGKDLYIIGGSWRAIGRIFMKRLNLPMQQVHGFALDSHLARLHAIGIATKKPSAFRRMPKKISARADILPLAAIVLAELIDAMRPRKVIFSGHGLREGLLHHGLKNVERI